MERKDAEKLAQEAVFDIAKHIEKETCGKLENQLSQTQRSSAPMDIKNAYDAGVPNDLDDRIREATKQAVEQGRGDSATET